MLATKSNTYTFKNNGIWYFSRRVPADLRRHYKTGRIAYSLGTRLLRQARIRAVSDAAKLDRHWYIMRMSADDLPGKHMLDEAGSSNEVEGYQLSGALSVYLRQKGAEQTSSF